jgi:predicted negative regulator of RcsB-dependent stress response
VSEYETDDEKVEAIKKWWKENGTSIVFGVAIGLALVFGWRAWSSYRDGISAQASAAFEQVVVAADSGQVDSAIKQAELLNRDYASTPYAALASLVAARVLYDKGDATAAVSALEKVVAKPPEPALGRLAAVRLARIQVAQGQLDAAAATVAAHDDGQAFAGDFAAVRGDIAAARGDMKKAREEYEKAIAAGTGSAELVRLKLDNLPAAG